MTGIKEQLYTEIQIHSAGGWWNVRAMGEDGISYNVPCESEDVAKRVVTLLRETSERAEKLGFSTDKGYFLAVVQPSGKPGKPIGNEHGAVMLFEELNPPVWELAKSLSEDCGQELGVFQVAVQIVGRVYDAS